MLANKMNVTHLKMFSKLQIEMVGYMATYSTLMAIKAIQKNKDDGIEVNVPETGYLRITLLPADTKIPPLKYYVALQIKWSETRIYETVIKVDGQKTDRLEIVGELVS